MAGIYIHVPFCRKACHYCDFHFSTTLHHRHEMLLCMERELQMRCTELQGQKVHTIYFGGGTPSLLTGDELQRSFEKIYSCFDVAQDAEITLEANPDDLSREQLRILKTTPVNRLSIGLQSYQDELLKLMNRSHTAAQNERAVKSAQDAGFHNLSVDLIFAIPGLEAAQWQNNVQQVLAMQVPHLSAYCLTIEEKTAFGHWAAKGKLDVVPDEKAETQFLWAHEVLTAHQYHHYEVSNYALAGFESRHNSSYWQGAPYLGIGPSAHSFDGYKERSWNVAHNHHYMQGIINGQRACEKEVLDDRTQLNEYIMTRLRTSQGLNLSAVKEKFHFDFMNEYGHQVDELISKGFATLRETQLQLTAHGMLRADAIASGFFVLQE